MEIPFLYPRVEPHLKGAQIHEKGILISGIITIVIYGMMALIFGIVGAVQRATKSMAETGPGAIPAEELAIVATVFLVLAGYFLVGLIFSAVLIGKRNSDMGKGAGITLGVFGITLGAVVPGIFFLVDSASTRG
ncbi:MAG: hypothetical protein K6F32_04780 [Bacilli bacterium]|nr:hypothetical protein [Bacilli bacterium]